MPISRACWNDSVQEMAAAGAGSGSEIQLVLSHDEACSHRLHTRRTQGVRPGVVKACFADVEHPTPRRLRHTFAGSRPQLVAPSVTQASWQRKRVMEREVCMNA